MECLTEKKQSMGDYESHVWGPNLALATFVLTCLTLVVSPTSKEKLLSLTISASVFKSLSQATKLHRIKLHGKQFRS